MDKILLALYEEIAHGDQEHRDWLYQKMEEFFEREVGKQLNLNMSEARTLTFGEKAVGLTFNPGGDPEVIKVKALCADLIDKLNDLRNAAEGAEKKRMYSVAITEAQTSQMWAVKAITWQY